MVESLKPLPKEIIGKYLVHVLPIVAKQTSSELNIAKQDGINVGMLKFPKTMKGEVVLKTLNIKMLGEFDKYIESELNDLASHFNRSLIFFESEINDSFLFIRWG